MVQLSSRLFVGTELCRNKEWLHLAKSYTLDSFAASRSLRSWPMPLRRPLSWILPEWRTVRRDVRDARRVLAPVIKDRLERNRQADEQGVPRPKTKDTIQVSRLHLPPIASYRLPLTSFTPPPGTICHLSLSDSKLTGHALSQWLYDAFPTRSAMNDIADAQLALSVVAIHTTSELLTGILLDLAQNQGFIQELRDEAIDVLTKDREASETVEDNSGKTAWKKTSLYQMKLMDSALKESQRMHVRDIGKC